MLINRCFNIGKYIATIREANMNPRVPQCKNCWKWGHATFLCRIQDSKCIRCNSPHKSENHREFGWCCKLNDKINPPRLETKKANFALTHSNVWITVVIIKPTPMYALSSAIISIRSGKWRSILRSVRTGLNPSVLKGTSWIINEFEIPQNSIAKCSQKHSHHPNSPQDSERLRHHLNPRTPMVRNSKGPESIQQWRRPSYQYQSSPQLNHVRQNPSRQ